MEKALASGCLAEGGGGGGEEFDVDDLVDFDGGET